MKFQKTIDAIQFFEQDYRQIADFIFKNNLLFKVFFDVQYPSRVHDLAEVSAKVPLPDKVTLSMYDPVRGLVYFNQGDWLVVDDGEPKLVNDSDFQDQRWTKLEDKKEQ